MDLEPLNRTKRKRIIPPPFRQQLIGTYSLGHENVDLIAMLDSDGGYFCFRPERGHLGRVKVGLNYDSWPHVVAILVHETFEYAMTRAGCRFDPSGKLGFDSADYLFSFDHPRFSRVCDAVSEFITPALPALAQAWGKHQKEK